MNVPQKVIVDADVGSDDYLALLILLNAEALGKIIIVAIVCTMGNAARDVGCINTMRLLETLGRTDVKATILTKIVKCHLVFVDTSL